MHSWMRKELKLAVIRIEKALVITVTELLVNIVYTPKLLTILRIEGLTGIDLPGTSSGYLFDSNEVILFDDGFSLGVD